MYCTLSYSFPWFSYAGVQYLDPCPHEREC